MYMIKGSHRAADSRSNRINIHLLAVYLQCHHSPPGPGEYWGPVAIIHPGLTATTDWHPRLHSLPRSPNHMASFVNCPSPVHPHLLSPLSLLSTASVHFPALLITALMPSCSLLHRPLPFLRVWDQLVDNWQQLIKCSLDQCPKHSYWSWS